MAHTFSGVMDALPAMTWTTLPDGRCDFVSKAWLEFTGLRVEDALGEGLQSTIHPDDAPELFKRW